MSLLRRSLGLLSVTAAALAAVPGCTEEAPKTKPQYTALPDRVVPPYLSDSIYQYSDMTGLEPFPVSGYGLVANLRGTGGCRAPTAVRDYMTKELAGHQFGSFDSGYATPDKILESKDFAIVKVEGYLPPGARAGSDWSTWFDVRVSALAESDATSLAHGDLWMCDLKVGGANPVDPGNGMVSVKGQAAGAVFVNPTYVLDADTDTPAARGSRRTGYVLAAARAMEDRPLIIRLRSPERRLVRAIERRINERFQDVADADLQNPDGNTAAKKVANAQDEAGDLRLRAQGLRRPLGTLRRARPPPVRERGQPGLRRPQGDAAGQGRRRPQERPARDQLRLGGPGQAGPARPGPAADRRPGGRAVRRRPGGGVHRRPRPPCPCCWASRPGRATRSGSTPCRPWASCPARPAPTPCAGPCSTATRPPSGSPPTSCCASTATRRSTPAG